MGAIKVLCLFTQIVFKENFVEQTKILHIMTSMLELLRAGDVAVRLADRFDQLCIEFHTSFLQFCPQCATPKLHLMRHIVDGLRRHKVCMACGSGERLHRRSKTFGRFAFRSWQVTIYMRTINSLLTAVKSDDTFKHTTL